MLAFSLSGNTAIVKNLSSNNNGNKELFINNIIKIIILNTILMSSIYLLSIKYLYSQFVDSMDGISIATFIIILISGMVAL